MILWNGIISYVVMLKELQSKGKLQSIVLKN